MSDTGPWLDRMRRDWDRRALEDAESYIYSRDSESDEESFDRSGLANYNQLVRPYLPILLEGKVARECRAVEIGCGLGRMTRWFAEDFGEVVAIDISPRMIAQARHRLATFANIRFLVGSGGDLMPLEDNRYDLAFSYIVFQHIPSRAVIENYVREASRILRAGGVFKFQLNGDQSPAYIAREKDTWMGETFSLPQVSAILTQAGFSLVATEAEGTQYFVLTARKGRVEEGAGPRHYILPGEPWAASQLGRGWHEPVDGSWRPVDSEFRAILRSGGDTLFAGIYFWSTGFTPCKVEAELNGIPAGSSEVLEPGDQFFTFPVVSREREIVEVGFSIQPRCTRPPAVRSVGIVHFPA